jgi:hypothetical protein
MAEPRSPHRTAHRNTPSAWGDAAQDRDAGHDAFQADVYRYWINNIGNEAAVLTRHIRDQEFTFVVDKVRIEFPFTENGRLIGFADVAVQLLSSHVPWWLYFEIKPRIGSVGALIRQCRATEVLVRRSGNNGAGWRENFQVLATVYQDDPKLALLQELYGEVWTRLRPTEPLMAEPDTLT